MSRRYCNVFINELEQYLPKGLFVKFKKVFRRLFSELCFLTEGQCQFKVNNKDTRIKSIDVALASSLFE